MVSWEEGYLGRSSEGPQALVGPRAPAGAPEEAQHEGCQDMGCSLGSVEGARNQVQTSTEKPTGKGKGSHGLMKYVYLMILEHMAGGCIK